MSGGHFGILFVDKGVPIDWKFDVVGVVVQTLIEPT